MIAGGDFNQAFSNVDTSAYPLIREDLWQPVAIDTDEFGDDLSFQTDNRVPSCRSLDQPYKGADHNNFQYCISSSVFPKNRKEKFPTLGMGYSHISAGNIFI